jgi:hypothetical protein
MSYKESLKKTYKEELWAVQSMIARELESLNDPSYQAVRSLPKMLASASDLGKAIITLENNEPPK